MSRTACTVLLSFSLSAAGAAEREPAEGTIALTRFGARPEIVAEFLIQEATMFVPLRVPPGKLLTIRQVTATCTLSNGAGARMNFWTVRSSAATLVHHYLPIAPSNPGNEHIWIASERIRLPVRAGGRPVATFQRNLSFGYVNEACVGSWMGDFQDATPQ